MDEELDAMNVVHPQQEEYVLLNLDAVCGQVDITPYDLRALHFICTFKLKTCEGSVYLVSNYLSFF